MNNSLIQVEKLSAALNRTIQQLISSNKLENIDKDNLKQQCVELYNQIVLLTPQHSVEEIKPSTIRSADLSETKIIKPVVREIDRTEVSLSPTKLTEPEIIVPPIAPVKEIIQAPLFAEITNNQPELTLNDFAETVTEAIEPAKTETELKNTIIDSILEKQQILKTETEKSLSLHEKLAHTIEPKSNLVEKLSATIPSLKNAINVNLKIALVNELFNTNSVEYVKAIDKLNSSENIHEAMRYFTELKHLYNWDAENVLVKELDQLITKRFA